MPILHSCCCWRSVRKGSLASGIYTMGYFILNAVMTSAMLHDELVLLRNNRENNQTIQPLTSFIDPNLTSVTSIVFNTYFLCNSLLGILTTLLLFYGLYRDIPTLFIPWMCSVIVFLLGDVVHVTYMFITHAIVVNPSSAILVTLDFFLIVLNIYALLCVISQYQELKAGRGRAFDELQINRVPNIHYSNQPTATSYLSGVRRPTVCQEGRPSPLQSPTGTGPQTSLATDEVSPSAKIPRKSVKFEHLTLARNGNQLLDPWTIEIKSPGLVEKGADTTPLIEPQIESNLLSNT